MLLLLSQLYSIKNHLLYLLALQSSAARPQAHDQIWCSPETRDDEGPHEAASFRTGVAHPCRSSAWRTCLRKLFSNVEIWSAYGCHAGLTQSTRPPTD